MPKAKWILLFFLLFLGVERLIAATNSVLITEKAGVTTNNYPVQIGRPFVQGEMANFPQALVNGTPVSTQADVKQRWPDGSVKHAILSFLIPTLTANGSVTVTFQNQTSTNSTPLTKSEMVAPGFNFDAIMELTQGTTQTASARTILNNDHFTYWTNGSIATTVILADHAGGTYDIGWKDKKFTTLSASISSATTDISVTHAGDISLSTTINIDNEQLIVLSLLGNTLTVLRGVNGTSAASHTQGALVESLSQATTEWVTAPNATHRSFRPIFIATFWPTINKVQIRFIGEISDTRKLQDQVYSLALKTGDASPATVYTKSTFTHTAAGRWTKEFWIGGAPSEIAIDHNTAYLIATKFLPNYDLSKTLSESTIAAQYTAWTNAAKDIYDGGRWTKAMATTGGRQDIGPYPAWTVRWFYTWDNRMREHTFGQANLAAAWPVHLREGDSGRFFDRAGTVDAQGRVISVAARPSLFLQQGFASSSTSAADRIVPVGVRTNQGWTWDDSHTPDAFSVPYMLSGDYWYLEQMQFWSAWYAAFPNPGPGGLARGPGASASQSGSFGRISGQVRGQGWQLRNRVHTAALSPDGTPEKVYFELLLEDVICIWEGWKNVTGTACEDDPRWLFGKNTAGFGFAPNTSVNLSPLRVWQNQGTEHLNPPLDSTIASGGQSTWMEHFLFFALGRARELGYPTEGILTWFAPHAIQGITHPDFTPYHYLAGRFPTTAVATGDWFQTWAEAKAAYLVSSDVVDEFNRTLPDADHGLPNIALPALATVAGEPGGPDAWQWIVQNVLCNSVLDDNPKWAIVPRSGVPPTICSVTVASVTPTTATITWKTDRPSTSQVEFGLTTAYGSSSPLDSNLVYIHSVTLTGLNHSTIYHFRVKSNAGPGLDGFSTDFTFETLDGIPPVVSLTAPADGVFLRGTSVAVSADATDNKAVVGVQFKLDGANLGAEDTTPPFSINWNTTTASNGSHALSATARDAAGNTATSSVAVTVDNIPPTVTINQAAGQADPTNASVINFTVVFSETVSNFATGDVTLIGSAGATTALVTGSGTTYNVAVSGMTVSGTVIASIAAGVATDAAGNPNTASTSTDNTVTLDITPPTVTINQAASQVDPTNASVINFTVVFSETVSNFATGDVTLIGSAGATTALVTGSGTTYNVAVSGMTVSGTVIASIAAGVATDAVDNPNTASTSIDNTVTLDITPPTVTINQTASQVDPTNASVINFTVVFSETVSNFATGDVTLIGSAGATTALVTGSGTTYNVAVSGMTVSGTVIASIAAGVATDAVGNPNTASTSTDNTVTFGIGPSVTINQAVGQPDPTNAAVINFTVVFSETVANFATGDVMLSGTAGATTAVVTGSGTTYNVAVSGMTVSGTVIASIAPGVATNAAGNPNTASTSTDNTVTFNNIQPTVSINQAAGQADPTNASIINFMVVFSETVANFATGDVTLSGSAGATTALVTGSGTTYNVAVSGMTVSGTVIASIAPGVATNALGNPNTASTSTDNTVTFDNTPPTVSIAAPAEGATVGGTMGVSANAVDNIAIAQVQFRVDGANFGAPDMAAPFVIAWDTTTVVDGPHTLAAIAQDLAGNVATSTAINVTVDQSVAPPPPTPGPEPTPTPSPTPVLPSELLPPPPSDEDLLLVTSEDGTLEAQPSSIVFTGSGSQSVTAGASFATASGQQFHTMNVASTANASVDWTASVVAVTGGNWLSVSPAGGVTPTALSLHADTGSLPPGIYESHLVVKFAAGTKTLMVPVFLQLVSPSGSIFQVSPSRLSFVLRAGGVPASRPLVVSDFGNAILNWTAKPQVSSSTPWLSVSPTTGTTPSSATVTVNPASLSEGTHTGSIEVSSGTTTLSVPVSVSVLPPLPAAILLDPPTSVVDFVQGGEAPEPLTLNVSSRGASSFFWQASANTGTGSPSWLSVSPAYGVGSGSVQVSLDPSALAPRQYRATVDVSILGDSTTVRSLWVILNVYPRATAPLSISPPSVDFHTAPDASAPGPQQLRLASPLGFTTWTAKVLSGAGNWLAISSNSGFTPGFVALSVNAAGLVPGIYTAAVEFSGSGMPNSPQLVPVTLVVHTASSKPAITADRGSLLFVAASASALPPFQTVTVKGVPEKNMKWTAMSSTANGLPWLVLDKTSGTTPETISVSVNPSNLASGKHVGEISLLAAGADNWSVSIPVSLLINDSAPSTPTVSAGEISLLFLPTNFQSPIGVPLPIQVLIRDSKGLNISGAKVNVQFSTGESLALTEAGSGVYSGWWVPAVSGPVGIRMLASKDSFSTSFSTSGTIVSMGVDPLFIFDAGVLNAAFSLLNPAPLAPGSLVSVFGSRLLDTAQPNPAVPLPSTLGGAKIFINEFEAALQAGIPGQFNLQVPFELEGKDRAVLRLERNGIVVVAQDVRLTKAAPAVFTRSGSTLAAALHGDGTPVTSERPAKRGEVLAIFTTGLGPTTTKVPTGSAPSDDSARTEETPQVFIAGVPATVSFSGLAPGFPGVYQINVQVPPTAYSGSAVPLVIRLSNLTSDTATLAIE